MFLLRLISQNKRVTNKLLIIKSRGSSQFGFFPVKDRKGVTISDKERDKERWAIHFESVPNRDRVIRKDIE